MANQSMFWIDKLDWIEIYAQGFVKTKVKNEKNANCTLKSNVEMFCGSDFIPEISAKV